MDRGRKYQSAYLGSVKRLTVPPGHNGNPVLQAAKVGCGGGRCGPGNRPPRRLRLRPHRARQLPVRHFGQEHSPVGARQRLRAAYPRPGPPASPSAPASRVGLGALRWNQSLARDALTEELLDAAANTLLIDWKEQAPVD